MRKKLLILLLVLIILLQAFVPVAYAASKNDAQSQTAYFCPSDATSKGASSTAKAISNSSKDLKVIGRLEDTAFAKNWKGHDVLNDPNWTLAKNDEWVNDGIKNKQDFYIASPMTEKNLVSTNPKYPGPTVFAREIDMLKNAGYVQKGDYFIHPSNLK